MFYAISLCCSAREFVHETPKREQRTASLSQQNFCATITPKKGDVDYSSNKLCCLLIWFINVDVVHCLGLILLNWGIEAANSA